MRDPEEAKRVLKIIQEITKDWEENSRILQNYFRDFKQVERALGRTKKPSKQSNLIKLGLTFLAFPIPIIVDDALGCSLLAAGLIQKRLRNSTLYIEDLPDLLPQLTKEIGATKQEMTH